LSPDRDDLQSTAYVALVEAAHTFDPARNINFATYARHRIRGALQDYRRRARVPGWRDDTDQAPTFRRLGAGAELHGWVIGKQPLPPIGEKLETSEAVEFWLRRLPRPHAMACRLIYIEGKSQDEAAVQVGCSKSYFSRLHREAITWLIREYRAVCAQEEESPSQPWDHDQECLS
jgi:RNA polymerase sigma factor (sigma-70 family)